MIHACLQKFLQRQSLHILANLGNSSITQNHVVFFYGLHKLTKSCPRLLLVYTASNSLLASSRSSMQLSKDGICTFICPLQLLRNVCRERAMMMSRYITDNCTEECFLSLIIQTAEPLSRLRRVASIYLQCPIFNN